jgi:hypothetical protein
MRSLARELHLPAAAVQRVAINLAGIRAREELSYPGSGRMANCRRPSDADGANLK